MSNYAYNMGEVHDHYHIKVTEWRGTIIILPHPYSTLLHADIDIKNRNFEHSGKVLGGVEILECHGQTHCPTDWINLQLKHPGMII